MDIGTDIVVIERISKAFDRFGDTFLHRFLHPDEILSARKTETIAGYWAAKEAISKSLGCGIGSELSFHDIYIEKNRYGAPLFQLSESASERFPISESSLSISHDGGFAIAVAVIIIKAQNRKN